MLQPSSHLELGLLASRTETQQARLAAEPHPGVFESTAVYLVLSTTEQPAGVGLGPTKGKLPRWPHALPPVPSHLRLSHEWAVQLVYWDDTKRSQSIFLPPPLKEIHFQKFSQFEKPL